MIACAILSEIVYWYRPKIIRDADTNQIVSTEPKFKADLLQKSYADLADKFCISKKQVTDAVSRLVTLDLIEREFRTITVRGNKIPNVLYLRLNVDRLIDITVGTASQGDNTFSLNSPIPLKKDMYIDQPADNCHSVTKGFTQEDYTNTDNTTNNTTEITPSTRTFTGDGELDQRKTIANNIHLKELYNEHPNDITRINMLYNIICSVIFSKAKTIRINKENLSSNDVKNTYLKIGKPEILYVLDVLSLPKDTPIKNMNYYIKTVLYNSVYLTKEHFSQKDNNVKNSSTMAHNKYSNFAQRDYSDDHYAKLTHILASL